MIYRIIDVNLNRCMESLRIIEDINRFYLNQKKTTLQLKNIRHNIIKHFKSSNLLPFRDTIKDTAKFLNTPDEFKRKNIFEVIQSNCKRLQESSRVLEEFLKLNDQKGAEMFKKIRFYIYNLEKKILTSIKKEFDLSLYIIIDTNFIKIKDIEITVNDIIKGGATIIQLRSKNMYGRHLLNTAKKIKNISEKFKIPFIMDDRIDIAIASDADGIHVGQKDLRPDLIRDKFFYNKIIGYSASNEKEIKEGIKFKADYIGLGPAFQTNTKKDSGKPLGLQKVKQLYHKYNKTIPIVVIGGINPDTIKMCLQADIKNFAIISSILESKNIKNTTSQFKRSIMKYANNL